MSYDTKNTTANCFASCYKIVHFLTQFSFHVYTASVGKASTDVSDNEAETTNITTAAKKGTSTSSRPTLDVLPTGISTEDIEIHELEQPGTYPPSFIQS